LKGREGLPTKKIKISNKAYGEFNGIEIQLTEKLYSKLSKEKDGAGISRLSSLKIGRAVRGLKHLITLIKQTNKDYKIVLTHAKTKKTQTSFYINYEEFGKHSQKIFYPFYRDVGLRSARDFLYKKYPSVFDEPKISLSKKEIDKVEKDLPSVIRKLSEKLKNREKLIQKTTDIVIDLKMKKKVLKRELESLQELHRQSSIYLYSEKLKEYEKRLEKNYPETQGKNSWQKWIYENNWLFGVNYQDPIQKEKVGFYNIPDFLFPTLDGFIDILEIKKPTFDVIIEDKNHAGSFVWSSETNRAIGQVVNYITQIELNQLQLKERINQEYGKIYESKIFTIKPRAFILIGRSDNWKEQKREGFRKLSYSLHGIEIITYTDLYKRGEKIIQMY